MEESMVIDRMEDWLRADGWNVLMIETTMDTSIQVNEYEEAIGSVCRRA